MRNDHWSNEWEIKKELTEFSEGSNVAGLPAYYPKDGSMHVFDKPGHALIQGSTGCGKSSACIIPMIILEIKAGESFVVVDPKGEIYRETSGFLDERYDTIVINLWDVFSSDHWNPLRAPYLCYIAQDPDNQEAASKMINDLAYSIYPLPNNDDPFWINSARELFIGVVHALFMTARPEQINIASVFQFIIKGEQRLGSDTSLKAFVESLPPDSVPALLLYSYISTANVTKGGIRSTFLSGLSKYALSKGLMQMLASDDLHINELDGQKSTAIYIIIPDMSPVYHPLAGNLCSQLLLHYINLAQDRYNGTLPRRLNVCLEELGNVGCAISELPSMMTAARSRNIRIQIVLQSLSQLNTVFGSSKATTILDNVDVVVAFRTNNWETLTELSNKCGIREKYGDEWGTTEPLITPSQLGSMETGQALVMIRGKTKYIAWLRDFREVFEKRPARELIRHKDQEEVATFDVAKYAKARKMKSVNEMFERLFMDDPTEYEDDKPAGRLPEESGHTPECTLPSVTVGHTDHSCTETRESRRKEPGNPGKKPDKKMIRVLVENGKCRTGKVIEFVASITKQNTRLVAWTLGFGPLELSFKTMSDANQFIQKIHAVDGIAFIKE